MKANLVGMVVGTLLVLGPMAAGLVQTLRNYAEREGLARKNAKSFGNDMKVARQWAKHGGLKW